MNENGYQTLIFEISDGVGVITMNRPDAGNSMNLAFMQEFQAVVSHCYSDETVRAVVITANGKLFSGGGDLQEFNAQEDLAGYLRGMTFTLHNAMTMLLTMDAPVIAAVNGTAGGAGFSLACCCDLIYAADHAKFTMAYTLAGLSPDGSSTFTLPRIVGERRALELALTNRRLTALEALDWGIVTQVLPADEVVEEAMKVARQLASGPTLAYGTAKRLIRSSLNHSAETQMEAEAVGIMKMARTHDGQEGVAAFMEKRRPTYLGR